MSATPPVPQDIAEIAAPLLLGTIWNWALYGVLVVQVYVYSYNFPGDRKLLKLLVYAIFLIETLQTALSGADLYYWFVSGFGNMDHLASPYAAAFDVPIIGAVVALTVQYFFAYRVWILSGKKSWWLCLAICVFSTIYATAAISAGIYAHVNQKFAFGRTLKVFSYNWVIANALADILITTAMFYYLTRQRGAEGRHFSNHMLSRIVRLTVETNLLTTADGIATLLLVVIFPNKNWYACPTAFLGKLYSNALLVSLNNRIYIREKSSAKGEQPSSRIVTLPPLSISSGSGVVHAEPESTPSVFKGTTQPGDGEEQEKVHDLA